MYTLLIVLILQWMCNCRDDRRKERGALEQVMYLQGPGIVYCSSRAWTERLTEYLRGKGVTGVAFIMVVWNMKSVC